MKRQKLTFTTVGIATAVANLTNELQQCFGMQMMLSDLSGTTVVKSHTIVAGFCGGRT
jgi:Holliday junction resolvasome RuvABC ATP-dependent DNA helicase subunit